jgi:hypothetical protein
MFKVIKVLEYPVSNISGLQASQKPTSVNVYDKMKSISSSRAWRYVNGSSIYTGNMCSVICNNMSH